MSDERAVKRCVVCQGGEDVMVLYDWDEVKACRHCLAELDHMYLDLLEGNGVI